MALECRCDTLRSHVSGRPFETNIGGGTMPNEALIRDLNQIEQVFGIQELLKGSISESSIVRYYTDSYVGYRMFHSNEGSIHMAVNSNGVFDPDGYEYQARAVDQEIAKLGARTVLEMGSGAGYNALRVARQNPDVEVKGIDITPRHIDAARKAAEHQRNVTFVSGDFHSLPLEDASQDLVFAVETLCHATDMAEVLREMYRVLKPGGHAIVFDGFRNRPSAEVGAELLTAAALVERSMAVQQFCVLSEWLQLSNEIGFEVSGVDDLSPAIMPNLLRLRKLSYRYFRRKWLGRFLRLFLPSLLVRNAVAGLLMPATIEHGVHGYFQVKLFKPGGS
jgi:arsenite methyltransferase